MHHCRIILILIAAILPATQLLAHCDAADGPVALDARDALDQDIVEPVLKWIATSDEPELRMLFGEVVATRSDDGRIDPLAERLFVETAVRLHRKSEGAPYEGVIPAGHQDPLVTRIDEAITNGDQEALAEVVSEKVRHAVMERFEALRHAQKTMNSSVEEGRQWVASYVELVHFLNDIHKAVERGGDHATHGGIQ